MESTTNHQIKVGLFLSIGIVALLVSIFLLGADKALFKSYVSYKIQFESVQGLNLGSVVSLAGLKIGNVESIQFENSQNFITVTINIEEAYQSRITEGTEAEIRTQGALGDKYVYIIPGAPSEKILPNGALLPVAKATDLIGIISERGKETEKLFDIINELHRSVKTINNEGRLDKIMGNLSSVSQNLKDTTLQTKAMTEELRSKNATEKINLSLEKMDRILTKIDKGQGTLGALVNDPTLHNQLKGLLGASPRKSHMKTILRNSLNEE